MKTLDMGLLEESKKADAEAEAKARYVVQCIKYAIKDPSRADKLRDALGEIDYRMAVKAVEAYDLANEIDDKLFS